MLIFMHSDWLYKFYNQSECLKISVAQIYAEKLFIGLGPEANIINILRS